MRIRRLTTAALLAVATTGALLAAAPAASAAVVCPGGTTLGVEAGVCVVYEITPTANTGFTVEGTAVPYCSVGTDNICQRVVLTWFSEYPYLDPTGADVNGATPPLPTFDPVTGQLSAPAGSYGTLYIDGIEVPLDTPAYCFTVRVPCP
jgi:hypothetical protein